MNTYLEFIPIDIVSIILNNYYNAYLYIEIFKNLYDFGDIFKITYPELYLDIRKNFPGVYQELIKIIYNDNLSYPVITYNVTLLIGVNDQKISDELVSRFYIYRYHRIIYHEIVKAQVKNNDFTFPWSHLFYILTHTDFSYKNFIYLITWSNVKDTLNILMLDNKFNKYILDNCLYINFNISTDYDSLYKYIIMNKYNDENILRCLIVDMFNNSKLLEWTLSFIITKLTPYYCKQILKFVSNTTYGIYGISNTESAKIINNTFTKIINMLKDTNIID